MVDAKESPFNVRTESGAIRMTRRDLNELIRKNRNEVKNGPRQFEAKDRERYKSSPISGSCETESQKYRNDESSLGRTDGLNRPLPFPIRRHRFDSYKETHQTSDSSTETPTTKSILASSKQSFTVATEANGVKNLTPVEINQLVRESIKRAKKEQTSTSPKNDISSDQVSEVPPMKPKSPWNSAGYPKSRSQDSFTNNIPTSSNQKRNEEDDSDKRTGKNSSGDDDTYEGTSEEISNGRTHETLRTTTNKMGFWHRLGLLKGNESRQFAHEPAACTDRSESTYSKKINSSKDADSDSSTSEQLVSLVGEESASLDDEESCVSEFPEKIELDSKRIRSTEEINYVVCETIMEPNENGDITTSLQRSTEDLQNTQIQRGSPTNQFPKSDLPMDSGSSVSVGIPNQDKFSTSGDLPNSVGKLDEFSADYANDWQEVWLQSRASKTEFDSNGQSPEEEIDCSTSASSPSTNCSPCNQSNLSRPTKSCEGSRPPSEISLPFKDTVDNNWDAEEIPPSVQVGLVEENEVNPWTMDPNLLVRVSGSGMDSTTTNTLVALEEDDTESAEFLAKKSTTAVDEGNAQLEKDAEAASSGDLQVCRVVVHDEAVDGYRDGDLQGKVFLKTPIVDEHQEAEIIPGTSEIGSESEENGVRSVNGEALLVSVKNTMSGESLALISPGEDVAKVTKHVHTLYTSIEETEEVIAPFDEPGSTTKCTVVENMGSVDAQVHDKLQTEEKGSQKPEVTIDSVAAKAVELLQGTNFLTDTTNRMQCNSSNNVVSSQLREINRVGYTEEKESFIDCTTTTAEEKNAVHKIHNINENIGNRENVAKQAAKDLVAERSSSDAKQDVSPSKHAQGEQSKGGGGEAMKVGNNVVITEDLLHALASQVGKNVSAADLVGIMHATCPKLESQLPPKLESSGAKRALQTTGLTSLLRVLSSESSIMQRPESPKLPEEQGETKTRPERPHKCYFPPITEEPRAMFCLDLANLMADVPDDEVSLVPDDEVSLEDDTSHSPSWAYSDASHSHAIEPTSCRGVFGDEIIYSFSDHSIE